MYLPSDLFELPYRQLVKSRHAASPPVLLLVALEPDALCACRILTTILKRDFIPHNIVPVSGYGDLERAGSQHVQPMRMQNGGMGGHVICLGTGGMVDLAGILGLEAAVEGEDGMGGVEVWVIDARRPWNLSNVFGGRPTESNQDDMLVTRRKALEVDNGRIQYNFRSGKGGIIVFDDGDVGQLGKEQEAYFELEKMPEIDDDGQESDGSESGSDDGDDPRTGQKRKSWSSAEDEDDDEDDDRPRQRRRSNSRESVPVTPTRNRQYNTSSDTLVPDSQPSPAGSTTSTIAPPSGQNAECPPSMRRMRRRLLRSKRAHEDILHAYYSRGSTYSEPISSLLYRLASDLGHASNDNLWLACVGVQSIEQYGRLSSVPTTDNSTLSRDELVLSILRDEVNRLNPPDPHSSLTPTTNGDVDSTAIPTNGKSPTDTSIRLSPEPRLLLIRHWSLYESMMHSPYLAARLHLWSEPGRKRLHKLLAKMGISLVNAKQGYVHMNMEAKRQLRGKLLKYAPVYGLEGLLPPAGSVAGKVGWGFVRAWGWKTCLSASDVGTILGAILEVGQANRKRMAYKSTAEVGENGVILMDVDGKLEGEEFVTRFWAAYDALGNVSMLLDALPLTMGLHKAILRTGTSLLAKRQIRHLRAFRMGVVKEGPDVATFTHPGALTKLALWLAEAIQEQEKDRSGGSKRRTPLVLASLNEKRGVYIVVGTGGGGGVIDMEERRLRRERLDAKKKEKEQKAHEKERKKEEKAAARSQRRAEREEEMGEDENDELEELEELDTESEASEDEDEAEEEEEAELDATKARSNRFGVAFQEVVDEVGATTRIDNFENCVIEVKREDLAGFLEALSMKTVVG